ncbi:MoaD family protein [Marinitoga litoralis]|jgi:molybdopterin synthase sulfur carrier subunit|uniref:MoaD family protein n=1 Tax=Marinitoga litoralis TaxID=570855 RepID=UPI0019613F03|nr:MoaD family protein [Marinitoga litoralis]MBM7559411.1 molybdopterin synthase sulfur carrier subunit [Marinitoga litoralis]
MKVEIKFFATLRLYLKVASINLEFEEPITVDELIDILVDKFNDKKIREYLVDGKKIKVGTIILINGKNIIHLNGLDTKIEEGVISIFPPAGGG